MHNYLIVILGPTGVGKTDTAASIAKTLQSEIISCDSRQFYREMKIGTSVPPDYLLNEVRHHFIRFIPVDEYYSSSLYERDVLRLLPELFARSPFVLMTGGSGLYIDAVCNGIDDIPDIDPSTREKFNRMFLEEGIESLRAALRLVDPVYYSTVDLKNHKRIIRALEIHESTGKQYSSFLAGEKTERPFGIIKIGLNRPRAELYERINTRVDEMITMGLEEEVKSLAEYRNLNALNTVGYKEFFEYFDGKISRETAIELIKRNTRRYAKRQLTWWARDNEIEWFHPGDNEKILDFIKDCTVKHDRRE
ncbi:MAG: tRNA (adenosine(37)-N6)-dimethylallyltransferase MiaA [Bacteroidales bacterium]